MTYAVCSWSTGWSSLVSTMSTHLVLSAPGDRRRSLLATLVVASGAVAWAPAAQALTFAESPLFLTGSVKPNVLVAYDNSQSMAWRVLR